ncbi:MAG: DUF853 family protein [Clostridia bacterium]|nr:DUF853 family protein [Clostridia bacterium]
MLLDQNIWVGTSAQGAVSLLPKMANRHGLISGATGTGKTVTLQLLAEGFSQLGVPVFLADVKGDLAGLAKPGERNAKIDERLNTCGVTNFAFAQAPVSFWDVFGERGVPIRTTVSEMGPLLLGRMLGLNDTQSGVLHLVFRIADDEGMLLIDLKDLKAMLAYVGDNANKYVLNYGNITKASVGAIQRAIAILEDQGGNSFFGEPALELADWLTRDENGQGTVNILAADKLFNKPTLYSTFLLWLLGELYALLPETGDKELPRMVFFFDEAHLLFNDCPKALMERIEQTVRLIRSKGVGVFFITQNPMDVPSSVLSQLSARVQHALRAFTPAEQKVVRAAAQTFRQNPAFDTETALTELKTGEALLSFLQEDGTPSIVQRATILPPQSSIGAISDTLRETFIATSPYLDKYGESFDQESAYEILAARYMGEGVVETQVVQPIMETAAPVYAQAAEPAQPVYAPMTFSVYNPQTGEYEIKEIAQMQAAVQPAPVAQAVPQAPAAAAQPPVLVWDASVGQYVAQAAPAVQEAKPSLAQQAKDAVSNAVNAVTGTGKTTASGKKAEKSYAQQLLDSFAKSATTSAGRETGRTLSRNLLGIFGLTSTGKKK